MDRQTLNHAEPYFCHGTETTHMVGSTGTLITFIIAVWGVIILVELLVIIPIHISICFELA